MRARTSVLVLAAALGMSGCSALGGSDNPTFVPTEASTPATPDITSTPDNETGTTGATASPTAQSLFVLPEDTEWLDSSSVPVRVAVLNRWQTIDNLAISRGQVEVSDQYTDWLAERKQKPADVVKSQLSNGIVVTVVSLSGDDEGSSLNIMFSAGEQTLDQAAVQQVLTSLKAIKPTITAVQTGVGPGFKAVFTRAQSPTVTVSAQMLFTKVETGVVIFWVTTPDAKLSADVMNLVSTSLSPAL